MSTERASDENIFRRVNALIVLKASSYKSINQSIDKFDVNHVIVAVSS